MKAYESPTAEIIEFEVDSILTGSGGGSWGTNCNYQDGGDWGVEDEDCDLDQTLSNQYEYPVEPDPRPKA